MPAMFSIEPRDASVFYVCSCVATLGMNGGVGKTVMFDRRDAHLHLLASMASHTTS